jgi:hypothetical protein
MKVVCINDKWSDGQKVDGITLGKIYDVKKQLELPNYKGIQIYQDDGSLHWYSSPKEFFITLDEFRLNQLDRLYESGL